MVFKAYYTQKLVNIDRCIMQQISVNYSNTESLLHETYLCYIYLYCVKCKRRVPRCLTFCNSVPLHRTILQWTAHSWTTNHWTDNRWAALHWTELLGLGQAFQLNIQCFVVNSICGLYFAVFLCKKSCKCRAIVCLRYFCWNMCILMVF